MGIYSGIRLNGLFKSDGLLKSDGLSKIEGVSKSGGFPLGVCKDNRGI